MKNNKRYLIPLTVILFAVLGSRCGGSGVDNTEAAKQAVENYYRGLEAKNEATVINATCVDWESQARNEVGALLTIDAILDNLSCEAQEDCKDGQELNCDYKVVCQGRFVFTYGEEIEELPLIDVAKAIYEDGEYRMCGYYE